MLIKILFRRTLLFGVAFALIVALDCSPFETRGHTSSEPKSRQETIEYRDDQLHLAFRYPGDWQIEEGDNGDTRYPDAMKHQIRLKGIDAEYYLAISIFPKLSRLEDWLRENKGGEFSSGQLDLDRAKATVNGKEAFMWQTLGGHDYPGISLAIQGDHYVYYIGFPVAGPNLAKIQGLIESLSIEVGKDRSSLELKNEITQLPLDIQTLSPVPLAQSCCETDQNTNTYPCCNPGTGNCTWKSEERRSGSNNFVFGGAGTGRDAYRWMSLSRQYAAYAQGGNIPVVGAVLVAITSYGGVGHVGTVSSINADGSVTLIEQNCDYTCTRSHTYDTTWLRTYLAGYIYNSSSPPTPTPKNAGAGETIVDDFNFSNTYNFVAKGPGAVVSWNGNERAWGTSNAGAYNNWMHYTTTRTGASENAGQWSANVLNAGYYDIQAYIPNNGDATANGARYRVNGTYSTAVNQSANHGAWVKLSNPSRTDGNWNLTSGVNNVELADTDGGSSNLYLAFDAIKFMYVGSSGTGCTGDTGEPNDSFAQAYTVSCNATTQAKICSGTDIDYYRFTPSGSGNSTITLTPPSDRDYDLFIYNSSLQEICNSQRGIGLVDSCTVTVSNGQTYYIKVIGYNGAFSTTNSYGLGVSCPSGGTTPAVTSFAINNGAASTTSQNVILNNSATGSPTEYQASESSSFSGASWLTYSTAPSFTLSAGTGTKTVYFRIRNSQGTISSAVSDSISFTGSGCADTGEPNDSFAQASTVSCNTTTQAKICTATDIDYYRFTPSGSGSSTITLTPPPDKDYDLFIYTSGQQQICSSTAGTGSPDSCTVPVSSGQTYYVKVIGFSAAFSTTSNYSLSVSCPSGGTTPVVTSFAINNGAASTTSQNVTLNNSATGSPTEYQASESSAFSGANWLSYSTAPGFTLSAGNGTKTIYFRVRNSAGIVSASVSDGISLSVPGTDNSAFVADVTVPDNTQMSPGQGFTKIWRLRNTGTTTWASGYSFAFVSGSQMSAPGSVSVASTAPGATVDIPVPMTAPGAAGTYQGNWRLRNPAGQLFGIEVWVRIVVVVPQSISWEFNSTANFEGWSCINIQSASVNSGVLFVDFAGADPYIVGPSISASASTYRYVQVRMASNALDSNGKIYFKTATENFYSEDKSVSFFVNNCALCGNAPFYQYSVSIGGNAKWSGTITGIRIDPANNASSVQGTDTVGFDYIRISAVP